MEKNVIKINESQIREMVLESVRRVLMEFTDIMKFPAGFANKKGEEWKELQIQKQIEKHPELDPNGFEWVGDVLKHSGEKRKSPKQVRKVEKVKPQRDPIGIKTLWKMDWDSRYRFGKFMNKSVREVYESGWRGREYVVWAYYNMYNIDYDESILAELEIEPIKKPGKNAENFKEWLKNFVESLTPEERKERNTGLGEWSHRNAIIKGLERSQHNDALQIDNRWSRGSMAWRNQGHR